MNPPLLLRRAQGRDAKLLTRIARAAKQHWGYPVEWMAEWRSELTVTSSYIRTQPVYVAKQARKVIGFFGLNLVGDELYLEHLWLRPEYIGKGLGRVLFLKAARQARATGATLLRIRSDPNAEGFYLKVGAERTGTKDCQLFGTIRRTVPLLDFHLR